MDFVKAVVYGLIQGLTEWLPISSTAHLLVGPRLLGWPDPGAAFTAIIQLGTTVAALLYFRRDLVGAVRAMIRRDGSADATIGWAAFWGTIPIIVAGLLLKDAIEGPLRSLWVVVGTFVVGGFLMLLADRKPGGRGLSTVTVPDGVRIGLFQCLALIPGMSRSGATISGARFLGLDREAAARASFLLSIPATAGAGFYQIYKARGDLAVPGLLAPTLVATVIAGVVGYATIALFIGVVRRRGVTPFVLYRFIAAAFLTGLLIGSQHPV